MIVMFVVLLAVLATWPVAVGLHQRWTDWGELTYTHGYLIAAICIFLVWRANYGKALPATRSWNGAAMALVAALGLLWTFSTRAGIAAVDWLIWPAMLLLAAAAAFGKGVARRNLFAIGFLYFAMPLWGSVNGLFQWTTIYIVRGMLRFVGIPAHFSGSSVEIPSGTFEVAGGCSGLSFVMVALALGALMGELRGDGWRMRARLLLLAGALAVFTNWIRVFSIILVGHYTGMRHYLVAESHYGYGWLLFSVAMIGFFVLERRWPMPPPPAAASTLPPAATHRVHGASMLSVALLLAAVAGYQWLTARPALHSASPESAATQAQPEAISTWQPLVQASDVRQTHYFRSEDGPIVERHRFIFFSQKQGKELATYGNDVLGGHGLVAARQMQLGHLPVTLHEVRDAGGAPWLIAVSYSAGRRHYASALPAQMHAALMSLVQLRSSLAALTVWRTPCAEDCPEAERRLDHFIAGEGKESQGT